MRFTIVFLLLPIFISCQKLNDPFEASSSSDRTIRNGTLIPNSDYPWVVKM